MVKCDDKDMKKTIEEIRQTAGKRFKKNDVRSCRYFIILYIRLHIEKK